MNNIPFFNDNSQSRESTGEKTAVEVVTEYIKSLILHKKMRHGDKIPTESELSQILNVGRGSVREAVKLLEAMNILDIRRGDGTYVSSQSGAFMEALFYEIILQDISLAELIDFRVQIEAAVINLAISNGNEEDVEKLRECYNDFEQYVNSVEEKDYNITHNFDISFHNLLGKCTKNRLMEDIYKFAFSIFSPMILQNYKIGQMRDDSQTTLESHMRMIYAIENHNFYAGIQAVEESAMLWKKWVEKRGDETTYSELL